LMENERLKGKKIMEDDKPSSSMIRQVFEFVALRNG